MELYVLLEQVSNRDGATAIVLDEAAVEVQEAEDTLSIANIARCGPVNDSSYFL